MDINADLDELIARCEPVPLQRSEPIRGGTPAAAGRMSP